MKPGQAGLCSLQLVLLQQAEGQPLSTPIQDLKLSLIATLPLWQWPTRLGDSQVWIG